MPSAAPRWRSNQALIALLYAIGPEAAAKKAVAEQRHLDEILAEDARVAEHLDADALARLFDPLNYQGMAQAFIDRLLASTER